MVRKRVWEITAALALLLTLGAIGGGAWHYHSLNRSLATALDIDDAEKALQLLRKGANPTVQGADGRTVLTVAAKMSDQDLLQAGLKRGLSVNSQDEYGLTPLMWAASQGSEEIVGDLLAAGADPGLRASSGHSALGLAMLVGKVTMKTSARGFGLSIEKPLRPRRPAERKIITLLRKAKARL